MRWQRSIGLMLGLLAGCAGTAANRYYILSVEPPPPSFNVRARVSNLTLAAVHLPGITDRPQLVVRTGAHTVDIKEFDRWAEPLDEMVMHVLEQDLVLRRGPPALERPELRVYVTIDEFMANTAGEARLTGQWWTRTPGDDLSMGHKQPFLLTQSVGGDRGVPDAAAMSILLGRLADEIVRG
jgi:uncharacterized lipoprotein YmbA